MVVLQTAVVAGVAVGAVAVAVVVAAAVAAGVLLPEEYSAALKGYELSGEWWHLATKEKKTVRT